MSLSAILDVAIGLVFVYLLLGLLASVIQEAVASFLEQRGKGLKQALGQLLAGQLPAELGANGLFDKVFGHSLLQSVSGNRLPSYLPANNVALAIFDTLKDGSGSPLFSQIESTVNRMPDSAAKQSLTALLENARGDIDALKTGVEKWFDDAMDRASGTYKRNVQYFLLGFGAIIAVGLNVDSITIARTLWYDKDARAAVVAAADKYVAATCPPNTAVEECAKKLAAASDNAKKQLEALPVPMGWASAAAQFHKDRCPPPAAGAPPAAAPCPAPSYWDLVVTHCKTVGWFWAIVGWLITMFAVSMGAPFWFDTLQRLLNLRAAGAKPERRT